ncbi:MAG: ATP-binding protein [Bacteroidales bacterium]|nr:ATP-binding protein [Bacteroidales bacterium]
MELKNIIKRDFYLQQLIDGRHNNMIKVVTGLRRSGKTVLLFDIFSEWLREENIREDHIVKISLDDVENDELREPKNMIVYLNSKIVDKDVYYVFIDEVQMMDDFVGMLNHLLHRPNVDAYVTGSNSKFLSKDVVTEFRGRGDEIHIFPFSFSEYYGAVGGDRNAAWRDYSLYGGLPQVLGLRGDKKKEDFLMSVQKTVYLKDLLERCNINNTNEFGELLQIVASSTGSLLNPTKLSNTFKSVKRISIDHKTICNYLTYMEDAFLIERSSRYDIRGKKYINSLSKYYFQDIGLRNAILEFWQIDEGYIMENVIYNELRRRGFRVDVGMVEAWRTNGKTSRRENLEVDFVAEIGSSRYYIQSALYIPDKEKREQEIASLRKIDDAFRRIIITKSDMRPYFDNNGFLYVGLFDFLLNPNLFSEW